MFEQPIRLIDQALDALPPDLLSHVRAGVGDFAGPGVFSFPEPHWDNEADGEILRRWIRDALRRVLEALGRDKRAAAILAEMLPKPWLRPPYHADLSRISAKARREFARIEREHRRIEPTWPREIKKAYRQGLEEILREGPQAHTRRREWPQAVLAACDEADAKADKADEEWCAAFFGAPAVWLWALWHSWPKVTRLQAIAGVPEWPGLKCLAQGKRTLFVTCIDLGIGPRINGSPGVAANTFKRALEQLRERLEGKQPPKDETPKDEPAIAPQAVAGVTGVVDDEAPLSPAKLAEVFGVPPEALRKRLERFRHGHHDGFVEVADRKPHEPQFLYRVKDVRPIMDDMKTSSRTSSKRPARKKSH
jgi:hypothetical protein